MPFHNDPPKRSVTHCHKVEARADVKQVRAIAPQPAGIREHRKRSKLNDTDILAILHEVETGHRSEWKDIAERSLTYKSYWVQWHSLAVRNGILKRNRESANGRSKIAQTVIPRSRVKDVLTQQHDGPSGHLGIKKYLE
jgi:hypothetical protein